MKLFQNKFAETMMLIPIVVFFSLAGYYFYTSYTKYNTVSKSLVDVEYIVHLDALLNEGGEEQGLISIFLGMNGKSDYKQLEDQWQSTDEFVKQLSDFSSKYPQFATEIQNVLDSFLGMKDERSKISVLNIKYEDLYLENYQLKPIALLLKNLGSLSLNQESVTAELLNLYYSIATLKENTMSERAFISYLVARSTLISEDELEILDKYMGKDSLSNYDDLSQNTVVLTLDNILKSVQYENIQKNIFKERLAILSGVNSGEFSIDIATWYELKSSKIVLLGEAQNAIYDYLKADLVTQSKDEKEIMTISVIVIIVSLLLLLVIRNIFSNMARETDQLREVLQNLETDSNDNGEIGDLEGMLVRQDKVEIYAFLEKTIRESKESKRLSDEANETKSKFLANMSHEIRTPLNGIVGFTELLKGTKIDEEQEEFIEVIEKSTENLLAVINDILDLSKIESDKIEIEDVPFDPIKEFESGIESYGAKAAEKGINLGFYIDPSLTNQLRGDAVRIKQVIVNLISNAVKFTPHGGEIDVLIERVAKKDNRTSVRFSVKDSGIGITSEQKEKIFEAFSQADSSTNRKFGGTGLGLTISKTFVELMDGKLDLESTLGDGARFFFTLIFEEIHVEKSSESYNNLNIAYYLPELNMLKQSDKYVKEYIGSLSRYYTVYDSIFSIMSLDNDKQPEILFIDYDYINDEDLKELNTLDTKIALLTTLNKKNQVSSLELDLYRVVYAPVNLSKIKKVMATFSEQKREKLGDALDAESNNIIISNNKSSLSHLKSKDILLCRSRVVETNIFNAMLQKIGYSVDIARDIEEIEIMVQANNYKFVLLDNELPRLADSMIAQKLNDLSVSTLLLVDNMQSIGEGDRENYTKIVRDVSNMQLLKHIMVKLIPLKEA